MSTAPSLQLRQELAQERTETPAQTYQRENFIRAMDHASEAVNQMTYFQPHEITLDSAQRIQAHLLKAFAAWMAVQGVLAGNPPPRRGD